MPETSLESCAFDSPAIELNIVRKTGKIFLIFITSSIKQQRYENLTTLIMRKITGNNNISMRKRTISNILLLLQMALLLNLSNSCIKEFPVTLPELSTSSLTNITSTSAICGGNVISDGGDIILARGVCWSTDFNPTIDDNVTTDGSGSGSFVSNITGLTSGTYYYIRSYATNSAGTAYGNEVIFNTPLTDIEGNVYFTARIGDQVWITENLRTTKYNDNTDIPVVTDNATWISLSTPACCWYKNNESNSDQKYGALYNWFSVNTGKLCPAGWHVPNEEEWTTLVINTGGEYYAGGTLKEQGTIHWTNPNFGASNYYGFSALPGGYRSGTVTGSFRAMKYLGWWWAATESDERWARSRTLAYDAAEMARGKGLKTNGYSVRCVKD